MINHERRDRTILVKGAPKSVKKDLVNIAANKGISLNALLIPHIIEIRNSYPESLRSEPMKD